MKRFWNFIIKYNGIIGFIIGVLGSVFAVYVYFYPLNMQPKLKLFLVSESFFARTDKKIDSLLITYKNRDIRKDSLNLLVANIKIVNRGRGDIKEGDYASTPFAVQIKNCKIIGIEVPNKENNVLANSLNPRITDSTTIVMNKVVFNAEEQVSFNVYLLANTSKYKREYSVTGKIAGQKEELDLFPISEDKQVLDWEEDVFIPIGVILTVLIIEVPLLLLFSSLTYAAQKKYRRTVILNKYDFHFKKELNPTQIVFAKLYETLGRKDFLQLVKGLSVGDDYIKQEEEYIIAFNKVSERRRKRFLFFKLEFKYHSSYTRAKELLEKEGLIKKDENGNWTITPLLKEEAEQTLKLFS